MKNGLSLYKAKRKGKMRAKTFDIVLIIIAVLNCVLTYSGLIPNTTSLVVVALLMLAIVFSLGYVVGEGAELERHIQSLKDMSEFLRTLEGELRDIAEDLENESEGDAE